MLHFVHKRKENKQIVTYFSKRMIGKIRNQGSGSEIGAGHKG